MTIETYPAMNTKIIELLRWVKDSPVMLYAAQRIEELEIEVEQLRAWREFWNEIIDANCWDTNEHCRFCRVHSSENHKEDCLFDRADTTMADEIREK